MTLARGSRVGPYEIVSLRGAGGMGEVYRARDTRLDRTVALKILPPGLSGNEELRARFEGEARAISALSHPNICALYDVGSDGGTEYLVMEFLEGETLAERLGRGPLPGSQLVRIGAQIAEALQQAHRAGITHRDLKPGNIMLTNAGAKLLDFGLAKFLDPAPRIFSEHSAPATRISPLTAEGTIVGTTYYMSPEQLEGKPVDHRSDIFSFGVILYEMATGQRPFRGDSAASLIAAILASDPVPVRVLQPSVAPALERIILTALEKNPEERWQTAHDVGRQLRWIGDSSTAIEQAAPSRRRRVPMGVWVAMTVVAALLGLAGGRFFGRTVKAERISMQIAQPPELEVRHSMELNDFAMSPDGRTMVFVAGSGGTNVLCLRGLGSFAFRKVEGSEGALSPFWSSDGLWIGYSARGKLWKTKVAGGAPAVAICDITPVGVRASWQKDTILFADTRGGSPEIFRVADGGGTPSKVTSLRKGEWRHTWPLLLADGQHFLYQSFTNASPDRSLILASLGSPKQEIVARNISFARMAGGDRLVYVRDGNLLSQPFDLAAARMSGEPETVATNVSYFYPTAEADFDASPSGVVVYRTNTRTGRLVLLDRKGNVTRTVDDQGLFWDHALSADGRKAAVTVVTRGTGLMDIWIYDLARGMRDRFTSEPVIEVSPAWSPDGRSIVYAQAEGGDFPHLVERPLTGSEAHDLTPRGPFQFSPSFSHDGRTLYYQSDAGMGNDILRMAMGTKKPEPLVASNFTEIGPVESPDGKWLAYSSNATGRMEVYLQSLGAGEPVRIRISNNGGTEARWRADGRELFYIGADLSVTSALPGAGGRWDEPAIAELFRLPRTLRGFAVTPDGQSFLISDEQDGAADALFHVVSGVE